MDTVAKRLADAAHSMVGRFTDIPYADWDGATEAQREFWREIARASQDKAHEVPAEVKAGAAKPKPRKAK